MELIFPMQKRVQLSDVTCRVSYSISDTAGSCWSWKLDPYQTSFKEEADIEIDLSENSLNKAASFVQSSLIYVESSGCYQHQIFRQQHEGIIWNYVRSQSQKLYLSYAVNKGWDRISLLRDNTGTAGYLAFEYLGQIIPGVLLKHGILTFHGVLMEIQGHGVIISAASGTGKTTHARLWRDLQQALIINGDRATVQFGRGEWIGCGLPWSGTSGEQVNRSVPLKALVILEQSAKNKACMIKGSEAFRAVFPHLQFPRWDAFMINRMMDYLDDFLCSIPVVRFSCRPDVEAVSVLKKVLEKL